jgi:DNA processing protein
MITNLTKRILTLSQLKGIGEVRLRQVVDTPNFANVSVSALASAHPALEKALQLSTAWDDALNAAERDIAAADAAGARIVSPDDDVYPALLRDAKKRPMILYVKGQWPNAPEKSVAIIGTRQLTAHGGNHH